MVLLIHNWYVNCNHLFSLRNRNVSDELSLELEHSEYNLHYSLVFVEMNHDDIKYSNFDPKIFDS